MSFEDWEDAIDEDNYTFVEDTYMQADELAEHAIPSPPAYDSEEDFDNELWQFDYWMDIDYASDGDEIRERQNQSRIARAKKRKLIEERAGSTQRRPSPSKRRKVHLPKAKKSTGRAQPMHELPAVMLMKNLINVRYDPQTIPLIDVSALQSWALIKDWRERFSNVPMWSATTSTANLVEVPDVQDDLALSEENVEMELEDEVRGLIGEVVLDGIGGEAEDEDWEDESEEVGALALDPEAVKRALRQNLAAIGVNAGTMDEETLMNFAMKMFAGGGDSNDVAGELADKLLGTQKAKVDEEEEVQDESSMQSEAEEAGGFTAWLREQAEEQAAQKHEQTSQNNNEVKTAELPTPASSQGTASVSPQVKRAASPMADVTAEPVLNRASKRKAEDGEGMEAKPKRRFDAPTKASMARTASGTVVRRGRK